jgi:surfactin synthase thioesterase subunit
MGVAALTNMEAVVEAIVQAIRPRLDVPCVFFGHSFGALVAYEVALSLHRHQLPAPVLFGVSCSAAPTVAGEFAEKDWVHQADQASFVEAVETRGLVSDHVLEDSDSLLAAILRPLRADVQVWERYQATPTSSGGVAVLPIPIIGFCGGDGRDNTASVVASWSAVTNKVLDVAVVEAGGRFHATPHRDEVLARLKSRIDSVVRTAPCSNRRAVAVALGTMDGHFEVIEVADAETVYGYLARFCNTYTGKWGGGIRVKQFESLLACKEEAKELAQCMEAKNRRAGIGAYGGCKTVLNIDPKDPEARRKACRALATVLVRAKGNILVGGDMNFSGSDLRVLKSMVVEQGGSEDEANQVGDAHKVCLRLRRQHKTL